METLPDELIGHILYYLGPTDLIQIQNVSRRFLRLGRDGRIWRFQCYYDSMSNRIRQKSWSHAIARPQVDGQQDPSTDSTGGFRARDTKEWDLTDPSEQVDWYSEYIARHAPLSVSRLARQHAKHHDVRGVALFADNEGERIFGPLEDGSVSVWKLGREDREPSRHLQFCGDPATSSPGVLFNDSTANSGSSQPKAGRAVAFSGVTDCVSVDTAGRRAYVAVGRLLNEVDLGTLKVISKFQYPCTITALSSIESPHVPLTVGTTFSLHVLDTRVPSTERSCSPPGGGADPANSEANFPGEELDRNADPARMLQIGAFGGLGTNGVHHAPRYQTPIPASYNSWRRSLSLYAQVEPAPLSILHRTEHSIMLAGRFPSILNYDRRYFPRLEYVIHSGARLSALAYLPFAPRGVTHSLTSERHGTVISCGEYNGRGSLELYSVADDTSFGPAGPTCVKTLTLTDTLHSASASRDLASGMGNPNDETSPVVYSYKNRQTASSAKLLSVATQGTRIVFSDADGGLKWVERDGRGIVRRWNINSYLPHLDVLPPRPGQNSSIDRNGSGAGGGLVERSQTAIRGDEVVRKIIPIGCRQADDLLIWTGENIGLVSFGRNQEFFDADDGDGGGSAMEEMVKTFDGGSVDPGAAVEGGGGGGGGGRGGGGSLDERAQQYDRQMRRALERQADELNWMQRFGFRAR